MRGPTDQIAVENTKLFEEDELLVRAIQDYTAEGATDLSFKKGDLLTVLIKNSETWWWAQNMSNDQQGYIPSSQVAPEGSLESQIWYFGELSRQDATRLILKYTHSVGSFLVRNSETMPGNFALSVRQLDDINKTPFCKHYRLRRIDSKTYFVNPDKKFRSIAALVHYYSASQREYLDCKLTKPCPKNRRQSIDCGPQDDWETPRSSITLERKLGEGKFGEVWKGLWKNSTEVAVKKLKPGMMSGEAFLKEASVMKSLCHRRLVSLLAVCSDQEPAYIITELMSKGSLLDCLVGDGGKKLKFTDLVNIGIQVAEGMAYLEHNSYVHRDLAARNILVDESFNIKIADFGLARLLKDGVYQVQTEGGIPIRWSAPEALRGVFTSKSDVWSFGVVLYELVTYGRQPYPELSNKDIADRLECGYRMHRPTNCTRELYDVMMCCWNYTPDDRPTFKTLVPVLEGLPMSTEKNNFTKRTRMSFSDSSFRKKSVRAW